MLFVSIRKGWVMEKLFYSFDVNFYKIEKITRIEIMNCGYLSFII